MTYQPQERVIQNRGVLIPTEEERSLKEFTIFVDVLGEPETVSKNYRYREVRTFYGYAQFLWKRRVVQSVALEFYNQVVFHEVRFAQQLAASLKCMQGEIIQSIANLGAFLGYTPLIERGYQHHWPELLWDRLVFQLEPGWIIQVSTRGDLIERCDESDAPSQPAPGAPSRPTPEKNPEPGKNGFPSLTPPYNPSDNDQEDTYTPPGQDPENPNLPPGKYGLKMTYRDRNGGAPYDPAVPPSQYTTTQSIQDYSYDIYGVRVSGYLYFANGGWKNGAKVSYNYVIDNSPRTVNVTGFISGEDELMSVEFVTA